MIRVYYQPWDRAQELLKVKVEVSLDNQKFLTFNEYNGFVSEKSKGVWAEIDLRRSRQDIFGLLRSMTVKNQWGEVEFWEIAD